MMIIDYIQVKLIDLPCLTKGFTRKNRDGSYTIVINARLSNEMQIATYDHEIRHIENGDYDHQVDVDEIEIERHAI